VSIEAGTAYIQMKGDFSGLNAEVAKRINPLAKQFGGRFGKALGPVMAQQSKHLETFTRAAKYATVGAAGLAAYGFADVVKKGAAFEKQMSVNAAVSEATTKQLARLEKQSLKLGKATFYSAGQAAEAQAELLKGGLKIQQVLGGGLPAALSLAEAGQLELATAAETTVNAMKLFEIGGKEAGSVADMLATAANKTTADVLDFAMALKQGGSVTKLAGYDMNETVTVLEALAEAGIKNSDAGTSMKTSVIKLLKPTEKQTKLAKELNLHFVSQAGELKSAAGLSKELRIATDGMTKAERAKTFATLAGTDGVRTLNALYSETPKQLQALERANAKQGTAQEIARKKMNNFSGDLEQLKGSIETAEISIYKGMAPALSVLAEEATDAANRVGSIFENENLSGSEKVERAISVLSDELSSIWDRNDMTEHLVDVLDAAIPIVAEHAGKLGLEFAEGFVRGFTHADLLGKAVMATWLLHFIGGKAPFIAAGKSLGKVFGLNFAAESAAVMAAGSLAPTVGGAATSAVTGATGARWLGTETSESAFMRSQGFTVAQTERQALAAQGGIFKNLAGGAAGMGATSLLGTLAIPGAIGGIGVYKILNHTGHEWGDKITGGIAEVLGQEAAPKIERALAKKKVGRLHGIQKEIHEAIQFAIDQGADDASLKPLRDLFNAVGGEIHGVKLDRESFKESLRALESDAIAGMGKVNYDLTQSLHKADQAWIVGTKGWRLHTANAMHAAVATIKEGMNSGSITADQGQKRINQLLTRIHLVRGDDPFGLAKATANSFKKSQSIAGAGVEGWLHKLDQMPKGAREKAIDANRQVLRAWADGHPKLEQQIAQLTKYETNKFGQTNKQLRESTAKAMAHMVESAQSGANSFAAALGGIGTNLTTALNALGVTKVPTFRLIANTGTGIGPEHQHPTLERQGGGSIPGTFMVPGTGSGDTFRTALPPGSWIENREAVRRLPFQSGGLTPVALEPKERVWLPAAVKSVGLGYLKARNKAAPRFQTGGLLHPEIVGGGPALREGEQHGVDSVWRAARRYLRRHSEPAQILHALRVMEAETSKGYPYVYGGGHGSFGGPYDCSGLVSMGLHAAGFIGAPMSVQQGSGLYTLGASGPGKWLTWGVRGTSGQSAHTMMAIKALGNKWKYFEAGGSGGGAHQDSGWDGNFQFRHMPGFQRGGEVPEKAQQAIAKFGQKAFDPKSPHFVGWGFKGGGFVGDINHVWPGAVLGGEGDWNGLPALPKYVAAALAEAAGDYIGSDMPGWTMVQVSEGEGALKPGSRSTDDGWGWLAITRPFGDSFGVPQMGGYEQMLNPVKNAYVAARMWGGSSSHFGSGGTWHGSSHVTDPDHHYEGNYDISDAMGGKTFGEAIGKPKAGERSGSGAPAEKQLVTGTYGPREGTTGKGGGTNAPPKHYKVQTDKLSFDSPPDSIAGCAKELERLRRMLREYRAAARDVKDPRARHDLEGNIKAIERQIALVKKQRQKLLQKRAQEAVKAKITKRGTLPTYEALIASAEEAHEEASEFAQQIVSLEPEEPENFTGNWAESILKPYVRDQETPAWSSVLEVEARWRNAILSGEDAAAVRLRSLEAQVETINALKKTDPKAFKKQKFKLGPLGEAVAAVRGLFSPPQAASIKDFLAGRFTSVSSGSFEDALSGLQGVGHSRVPMFPLPSEPVAGAFGGTIFDTQMQIRELGLKLATTGTEEMGGDLADIWKQIAIEANQRNILRGIEERVFAAAPKPGGLQIGGAVGVLPPYAGKAHTGAIVPGPPSEERTMVVRGKEGIFTEEQMRALGGQIGSDRSGHPIVFEDFNIHTDGRVNGRINGQDFDQRISSVSSRDKRREARAATRGLASPGKFAR
jgi:TP901 family phage tail tape measure protein